MNFYVEITLLPNVDINLNFLWEKVYKQIHLGLVSGKRVDGSSAIGIAFPEYDAKRNQLGTKLRLFAPEEKLLKDFHVQKWLSRLLDYVHITGIRHAPNNVTKYVRYKRQQSKSSTERLARRKAKRESIKVEEAFQLLEGRRNALIKVPFIKILSDSSRQNFRLFIVEEHVLEKINNGFSCYGLSALSTIPNF